MEDELREVEFPHVSLSSKIDQEPDVKVNVDIEIIKPKAMFNKTQNSGRSYQCFKSCLTKDELIRLITDEVKIEGDQMIILINVINQASLSETQEERSEQKLEEIKSELKNLCIEIESKGLAECKQTDITSHKIEITDDKPIRHRVRPVPYHCRDEFHQIIKDQLAAGIIRPSKSATCSPVNLVLKEDGSLRLTIDYRKVNNATVPDSYPLPRIDDIIAQLAKNKHFSKIDLANGYYKVKMHPDSVKFTMVEERNQRAKRKRRQIHETK